MALDENFYHELKSLTVDPAWPKLISRIEYVVYQIDKEFHSSKDYREFLINQGSYKTIVRLVKMLKDPRQLCDDGVQKLGGEQG